MLSVILTAYLTIPTAMLAHKSLPLHIAAAKNSTHLQAAGQVIFPSNFPFLSHEYYTQKLDISDLKHIFP
jgi:hypothetical protein